MKKTAAPTYLNYGGEPTADPSIPYRLRDLINSDLSTPVIFCTDETAADAVAALGLVATTVRSDAGVTWSAALKKWFKRIVFMLPGLSEATRQNLATA